MSMCLTGPSTHHGRTHLVFYIPASIPLHIVTPCLFVLSLRWRTCPAVAVRCFADVRPVGDGAVDTVASTWAPALPSALQGLSLSLSPWKNE